MRSNGKPFTGPDYTQAPIAPLPIQNPSREGKEDPNAGRETGNVIGGNDRNLGVRTQKPNMNRMIVGTLGIERID
jgi:hypothetical protein